MVSSGEILLSFSYRILRAEVTCGCVVASGKLNPEPGWFMRENGNCQARNKFRGVGI